MKKITNLLLSKKALGALFAAVLLFNLMLFVNKDSKQGLTFGSIKAMAQYYGENEEGYASYIEEGEDPSSVHYRYGKTCYDVYYTWVCDPYAPYSPYQCGTYWGYYLGTNCY